MYDNIYTYYKNAKIFINDLNAKYVLKLLSREEEQGALSAEKYAYMSKAYVFLQNDKMALKYARMAIRADKCYPYGYLRLAFSYARLGKKRQALKFTKIADNFDLADNSFLLSFIAILYEYCEQDELLKQVMKKIEKIPSKGADYCYNVGWIYSKSQPEKALKYFKKAYELDYKDKFKLMLCLADCYSSVEDYVKAEFFADKCLSFGETYEALDSKVLSISSGGREEEAIKYLRKQYKLCSDNEKKVYCLSKIIYNYMQINNENACEKYIRFGLNNFEPSSALYWTAANFYELNGRYEEAIEMYNHMLEINPNDSSAGSGISYCYTMLGKDDIALEKALEAAEAAQEDSYSYYRLARAYLAVKDYKNAIENFYKALEFDSTDVDTLQWISYSYSLTGEFDKSLEFANRAILLDKDDSYSYFRKAWAYQEMGKYKEAIKYYEECIKHNDRYVDAYLNISYIYSLLHENKQSLLYANKALLINKDYAYAHYRKAWVYQEAGDFESAIDGYSKAIELDPTDVYNYLGIACVSLNSNENSNALLYANKAIFVDRNCGGAYYYKSLALSNLGKQKEAEKAYAKAIKLGYSPS